MLQFNYCLQGNLLKRLVSISCKNRICLHIFVNCTVWIFYLKYVDWLIDQLQSFLWNKHFSWMKLSNKLTTLVPIFKKVGHILKNYWPISLLCNIIINNGKTRWIRSTNLNDMLLYIKKKSVWVWTWPWLPLFNHSYGHPL